MLLAKIMIHQLYENGASPSEANRARKAKIAYRHKNGREFKLVDFLNYIYY